MCMYRCPLGLNSRAQGLANWNFKLGLVFGVSGLGKAKTLGSRVELHGLVGLGTVRQSHRVVMPRAAYAQLPVDLARPENMACCHATSLASTVRHFGQSPEHPKNPQGRLLNVTNGERPTSVVANGIHTVKSTSDSWQRFGPGHMAHDSMPQSLKSKVLLFALEHRPGKVSSP